jgi:catalase
LGVSERGECPANKRDELMAAKPVFPIRDGGKLPSIVHANKRNPATNLKDSTMVSQMNLRGYQALTVHSFGSKKSVSRKESPVLISYSYFTNNPEGMHHLMYLFSDAATPISYANLNIFSANLYKFTKTVRVSTTDIHND